MLKEDFSLVEHNDSSKYRISGADLIKNDKYLVKSNKNTLDRIENQLSLADFTKNRSYLAWQLPRSNIDEDAILPDYKEPIDNWWGDIPSGFVQIKKTAYSAMFKVEEIYNKLKDITEEVDPIKTLEIIDDIRYECRDGHGEWSISLPNDLYDEEFESACNQHIKIVSQLRKDGLLDNFLKSKSSLRSSVSDYICSNLPINPNTVHSVIINFKLENLQITEFKHNLVSADKYWSVSQVLNKFGYIDVPEYDGIKNISQGKFECFWLPGRIHIKEKYKSNIEEFYKEQDFRIYLNCMSKILNDKYHFDE